MTNKVIAHICELKSSFLSTEIWIPIGFIQILINQYIFSEWNFAIGFFGMFLIDTWSGMYIAYRNKIFSPKILRDKLLDKSVAYFSIIIAYSMATKITLSGSETNLLKFSDLIFYSVFVTAEVFSIIKNWYIYKKWPALKTIMKHFAAFDDKGNKL